MAFVEEDGQVVLTKAAVVALRNLQETLQREAEAQGRAEEDLLRELVRAREGRRTDPES